MIGIIGIDADARAIAWAGLGLTSDAPFSCGMIPRTRTSGRFFEDYDRSLTLLMRRAGEVGAALYVEDIFLTEYSGRATARNVTAYRVLSEVQGELKRAARMHAVPFANIHPNTWHTEILGFTTNRDKLKVAALEIAKQYFDDPTSHEADALCVALCAAKQEQIQLP